MNSMERIERENSWNKGPATQHGADAEQAVLGIPKLPQQQPGAYLSFKDAVELVREAQPNSFDRSRIIIELRKKVAALCHDKKNVVRFFTAVGTPLDVYHGVDAFFEQGERRVTLDISLEEKESHKADVLMVVKLDEEGEVTVSPKEMEDVSESIARQLNEH